MKRYTEQEIIKGMEGIYEEDLQKRLKDFYLKRIEMEGFKPDGTPMSERIRINKENNDLRIKVYEERLPLAIIERAKRSAGLYKTPEEISDSIKMEQDSLSEKKFEIVPIDINADAHNHTRGSDGRQTAFRAMLRAYSEGFNVMAVTDHDSVKGFRDLEKDHQQAKEKFGNEMVRLDEQNRTLNEKHDKIIENIWESYGVTLSEAQGSVNCDCDYFEARKNLINIKDKIKQLGSVNLAAISEYEEVSERYKFLNDQVSDAKISKAELEKLIKSLTTSMKNIFKNSFWKRKNTI